MGHHLAVMSCFSQAQYGDAHRGVSAKVRIAKQTRQRLYAVDHLPSCPGPPGLAWEQRGYVGSMDAWYTGSNSGLESKQFR